MQPFTSSLQERRPSIVRPVPRNSVVRETISREKKRVSVSVRKPSNDRQPLAIVADSNRSFILVSPNKGESPSPYRLKMKKCPSQVAEACCYADRTYYQETFLVDDFQDELLSFITESDVAPWSPIDTRRRQGRLPTSHRSLAPPRTFAELPTPMEALLTTSFE